MKGVQAPASSQVTRVGVQESSLPQTEGEGNKKVLSGYSALWWQLIHDDIA